MTSALAARVRIPSAPWIWSPESRSSSTAIRRGARCWPETRLERVQNVRSRQRVLERLLGVGTIDFDTAAGAAYDFSFRGVDDPGRIVRTVNAAQEEMGLTHPRV